jgi:AcrR family transcriptional regulator
MEVGERVIEQTGLEGAARGAEATGSMGQRLTRRSAPETETPSARYRKLRRGVRGADGLTRAEVVADQRRRLYEAMVEVTAARGYQAMSVKAVCALAGVSRRTFYDLYAVTAQRRPKEACFLDAYDFVVGRAAGRISYAYRREQDPERRLCSAFEQFAHVAVGEPETVQVALVEVLGAGPAALARMQRTRLIFEQMIGASLAQGPDGVAVEPLLVKGIVCGIERITRQLLLAGEIEELPALADRLLAWVLSYRCRAAAGLEEIGSSERRAVPWQPASRARVGNDRARILCSAAQIAAAGGYARLSPARIARAAEVSEARFEQLFESSEQCFLDALDRLGLEALVCVARASRSSDDRLIGLHRGITALMSHIASNPVLVRVAFVEIFAVGSAGIQRRERLLGQFTELLAKSLPLRGVQVPPSGRAKPSRSGVSPEVSGTPRDPILEASVGAIWGIVHDLVTRGAARLLPELAGYATYLALAPVIGGEAAAGVILSCGELPGAERETGRTTG